MPSSLYESYTRELDVANIFSVPQWNNKWGIRTMAGRWGGIGLELLLKRMKTTFNIVYIFKSCNFKSLFHVLSHTIRIVNRENAQIRVSSLIHLKKMEAISFKEWEFWMRTTWNAHVQSPDYCSNMCLKHGKKARKGRVVQIDFLPPHTNLISESTSMVRMLVLFIQGFPL